MISLLLSRGLVAIVDDVDSELSALKWHASKNRTHRSHYARRNTQAKDGTRGYEALHRAIAARAFGDITGKIVDHVNGNGLDNRRNNLRVTTFAGNARNSSIRKGSATGFKGVSFKRDQSAWVAQMGLEGKRICLGYFQSIHEACAMYDCAALLFHGEFAKTNYPACAYPGVQS